MKKKKFIHHSVDVLPHEKQNLESVSASQAFRLPNVVNLANEGGESGRDWHVTSEGDSQLPWLPGRQI